MRFHFNRQKNVNCKYSDDRSPVWHKCTWQHNKVEILDMCHADVD